MAVFIDDIIARLITSSPNKDWPNPQGDDSVPHPGDGAAGDAILQDLRDGHLSQAMFNALQEYYDWEDEDLEEVRSLPQPSHYLARADLSLCVSVSEQEQEQPDDGVAYLLQLPFDDLSHHVWQGLDNHNHVDIHALDEEWEYFTHNDEWAEDIFRANVSGQTYRGQHWYYEDILDYLRTLTP